VTRRPCGDFSVLRRALLASAALVAVLALPAPAAFADPPCPALAPTGPISVEFSDGSVTFRQPIFGHPGVVAASTGTQVPAALRAAGASTAYWEMNLPSLVGSPAAPADPANMGAVAAAEVQKAQASTGCPNPLIALNEMIGSATAGPLSAKPQQYRDAVLALMSALAADGATPFLLVPRGFTTTGTEDWWQQVAQVGWLVPEAYRPAPQYWSIGSPFLISRQMRIDMRGWVGRLTAIGIPAARIGLMLTFQSGEPSGGRVGLQPTAAWLDIVKLQQLAGLAVARDLGLSSVWSWGWGTFATLPGSADPDKPAAACTYLWARDQTLCNAPGLAIPGFDADLTAGAFALDPALQCSYTGGSFATSELTALTAAGVPVHVARGNRDFLLADGFAHATGATLLPDELVVEAGGARLVVLHGDLLCTGDADYQRYRARMHTPATARRLLALPYPLRRGIAWYLRRRSRKENARKPEAIMDVDAAAVAAAFRRHGVSRMIHGHTHRPARHTLDVDGAPRERVVLADWDDRGHYVEVSDAGLAVRDVTG